MKLYQYLFSNKSNLYEFPVILQAGVFDYFTIMVGPFNRQQCNKVNKNRRTFQKKFNYLKHLRVNEKCVDVMTSNNQRVCIY